MNRTKVIQIVILACVLMAIISCTGSNAGMQSAGSEQLKPIDLRCEYLVNPLGIDVMKPRLSWVLESNQRGHDRSFERRGAVNSPSQAAGRRWREGSNSASALLPQLSWDFAS